MSRHESRATNWIAPIIVSILVAGIAWTVGGPAPVNKPVITETKNADATTTTPALLADLGIQAPTADRDSLIRVDLIAGSTTKLAVEKGWRTSKLVHPSLSITTVNEGFRLKDGGEWDVALRQQNGQAYQDPRFMGLFDETHAAIVARSDATRVLEVSRAGGIRSIGEVPDQANVLGVSGGSFWLATFIPGEGIESEPTGPSKLIRVDQDEKTVVEATADTVIDRVVADGSRVAYGSGGAFVVVGKNWKGEGTPLLWLPDGHLLLSRGTSLFLANADGETRLPGTIPGAPSAAVVVE